MRTKIPTITALIGIGIIGRLIPHPPNATPIAAITRAAEQHLGKVWTFIIPLVTMLLSDAFIGFYNWKILISVYGSFLLTSFFARLLQKRRGVSTLIALALFSSFSFFFITNTAVWLFSPWYEKSVAGLLYCLTLGIPFLKTMLAGDIAYLSLFYAYELIMEKKTYFARLLVPRWQS